jgi:hypothetical protein
MTHRAILRCNDFVCRSQKVTVKHDGTTTTPRDDAQLAPIVRPRGQLQRGVILSEMVARLSLRPVPPERKSPVRGAFAVSKNAPPCSRRIPPLRVRDLCYQN